MSTGHPFKREVGSPGPRGGHDHPIFIFLQTELEP
jgi:hypothetical protein